ncbi:MAG: hypothetical protein ACRD22_22310 [Terriglobia bacterium]
MGLALATARVIAWIGILLVAAGVAYGIASGISRPRGPALTLALGMILGLIGYGLSALALSGGLAALIGMEESQRRRNERE